MPEKWSQKPEKLSVSQNDEIMILDNEDNNRSTKNKRVRIENMLPYKIYSTLLTQTGTNAPVAASLQNTIGGITWNRVDVGVYDVVFTAGLVAAKTFIYIQSFKKTDLAVSLISAEVLNISTIRIFTFAGTEDVDASDNMLNNTPLEVRIYP